MNAPELMAVDRIRLVEGAVPHVSPTDRLAMDRAWEESVRANPSLFDGPVVACTDLAFDGLRGAVITWVPTTCRRCAGTPRASWRRRPASTPHPTT